MALFSSKRCRAAGLRPGVALALGISSLILAARGQAIEEYALKAAFLSNFARFVEWPRNAFKSPTEPIVICILGESPFGDTLDQAIRGKAVDDRKLVLRQLSDARQAAGCHILFVGSSETRRLRSILTEIRNSGILTVGETDDFTSEGGVVNLKLDGGRIRIQVNVEAAEQERIQISSRLLSLAQIVKK